MLLRVPSAWVSHSLIMIGRSDGRRGYAYIHLRREQADGIIADAESPAVKRWTVGRESSDDAWGGHASWYSSGGGGGGAEGSQEGQEGFSGGSGGGAGWGAAAAAGGGFGGGGGGEMHRKPAKGKGSGTPRMSAVESASLFADFAFNGAHYDVPTSPRERVFKRETAEGNCGFIYHDRLQTTAECCSRKAFGIMPVFVLLAGLETVRDAYGRDITPVKPPVAPSTAPAPAGAGAGAGGGTKAVDGSVQPAAAVTSTAHLPGGGGAVTVRARGAGQTAHRTALATGTVGAGAGAGLGVAVDAPQQRSVGTAGVNGGPEEGEAAADFACRAEC